MSMRTLVWGGWVMIVLGVVLGVGGIASGIAAGAMTGVILLVSLAGGGAFMVWLGRGWDKPAETDDELHRYGRPANARILEVSGTQLDGVGGRTAKLKVRISPVNESEYEAARTVTLPGGRIPAPGEVVTVKFDPQRRRSFVLLADSYEVKDHINATADALFGGLQKS